MGDYAKKPEPTTSAAAAPAKATAPAPKAGAAIEMPSGPATYDADRLVARLLQTSIEHGERALAVYTADRQGRILVATEEVTAFVRELVAIGSEPKVRWDDHAEALAHLALLVDLLVYETKTDALALSAALSTSYAQFVFLIPTQLLVARPARGAGAPMDQTAQLDLARHAMGAVRQHLEALPELDPKNARAQAAEFCAPLKLHLAVASDAAAAVTDRRARRTLKPDVEAVSVAMDELSEALSMKPAIPWDVSFASAFDAENGLRAELGLPSRPRAYSGTVDPQAAMAQVRAISNGVVSDPRAATYADPTSAVQGIHAGIEWIFKQQARAVNDLHLFLRVKDPPAPQGWVEQLLEIGANVALMAAAGAIGGAVSTLLKPRLEALQVGLTVPSSALALLSKNARSEVTSDLLSRGVLARSMVGDALKDGSKEMFKAVLRKATSGSAPPVDTPPLDLYVLAQQRRLGQAMQHAGIAVQHLSPALQQADLAMLNVLAHTLEVSMQQVAYDRQYDSAMREWQNYKARLAAGPATLPMGRENERDAAVGEDHTAGVLEIGLAFSADRVVSRRSLRLNGAEPAARAHFRRIAVPIGEVGLNQRYEVLLVALGNSETLVFGVAPDRGLLLDTLSRREWQLLRMLAEREPATLANVNRALRGEFDSTADSAAIRVAKGFVQAGAAYSTGSLED